MNKNAFTMIELVFVIVILGILASVAIPRLAATRNDAIIAKGRADILAIRSGIISERQGRMFRGDGRYAADLNSSVGVDKPLFGNIMAQTINSGTDAGDWQKVADYTYRFYMSGENVDFTYDPSTGIFDCTGGAGTNCALLTD